MAEETQPKGSWIDRSKLTPEQQKVYDESLKSDTEYRQKYEQSLKKTQPNRPTVMEKPQSIREQPVQKSRSEEMRRIYKEQDEKFDQGVKKDEAKIEQTTKNIVHGITRIVQGVGAGAEAAAKTADKMARGLEHGAKLTVKEGWEVTKEAGKRTLDVLGGIKDIAFKGAKLGAKVGFVVATSPVYAPVLAGEGLVRGAHELSSAKIKIQESIVRGALAKDAAVDALQLTRHFGEERYKLGNRNKGMIDSIRQLYPHQIIQSRGK